MGLLQRSSNEGIVNERLSPKSCEMDGWINGYGLVLDCLPVTFNVQDQA